MALRIGSRGNVVRLLQQRLNAEGAGLTVDGHYGRATRDAVLRFQQAHHLSGQDGVVGRETGRALMRDGFDVRTAGSGRTQTDAAARLEQGLSSSLIAAGLPGRALSLAGGDPSRQMNVLNETISSARTLVGIIHSTAGMTADQRPGALNEELVTQSPAWRRMSDPERCRVLEDLTRRLEAVRERFSTETERLAP